MKASWPMAVALAVAAVAAGAARAQEATPPSLDCTFEAGTAASYDGGAFKATAPAPLAFQITGIDLEEQSAELRTAAGPADKPLRIVRAINANHFLEVVNEGFLNLTTVYDKDPATGLHPAVHSRHYGVLGQPVVGHYQGFCRPAG